MDGAFTYEKLMESVRLMQSLSGPPVSTGLLSGFGQTMPTDQTFSPVFSKPRIFTNPSMLEQFRFPRSKGKRIQKKWQKNYRNFRACRKAFVDQGDNIYCHPSMYAEIKRVLDFSR